MSSQRRCRIEKGAAFDDSKSRDMRGVVSEGLRELVGVGRGCVFACGCSASERDTEVI